MPTGLTVSGADTRDKRSVAAAFDGTPMAPPAGAEVEQNVCMDEGCDYADVQELSEELGYARHIVARGEELAR